MPAPNESSSLSPLSNSTLPYFSRLCRNVMRESNAVMEISVLLCRCLHHLKMHKKINIYKVIKRRLVSKQLFRERFISDFSFSSQNPFRFCLVENVSDDRKIVIFLQPICATNRHREMGHR